MNLTSRICCIRLSHPSKVVISNFSFEKNERRPMERKIDKPEYFRFWVEMLGFLRKYSTKVFTKKQMFFDTITLRAIGGSGGRGVSSFLSLTLIGHLCCSDKTRQNDANGWKWRQGRECVYSGKFTYGCADPSKERVQSRGWSKWAREVYARSGRE